MNIFKKIQLGMTASLERLKSFENEPVFEEEVMLESQKVDSLNEIIRYANKYEYLSKQAAIDRVRYYLKSNYSNQKTADKFGSSLNASHVAITYASNKLKAVIGEDTVDQIILGNIEEGMKQFRTLTGVTRYQSIFNAQLEAELPEPQRALYSFDECIEELIFITTYTNHRMLEMLNRMDRNRLAYILFLIDRVGNEELNGLLEGRLSKTDQGDILTPSKQVNVFLRKINDLNVF